MYVPYIIHVAPSVLGVVELHQRLDTMALHLGVLSFRFSLPLPHPPSVKEKKTHPVFFLLGYSKGIGLCA